MFKKIGDNLPNHHLLFFSAVLTALFFIVLFSPFKLTVERAKVEATGLPPNININTPVNNPFYTTSPYVTFEGSIVDPEGDAIDGGSTNITNLTTGENLGNLVPYPNWSQTNSLGLNYGLNEFQLQASADGDMTTENFDVYRLPSNGELYGYAWTSTIGWISMSSKNESSGFDYGVVVDPDTGNLSGYGWSENVGWINFASSTSPDYSFNTNCYDDGDNSNNCVDGSGCSSCYAPDGGGSPTGGLYGWANVASLGDEGWIRLDDHNGGSPDYGVDFDIEDNQFSGYAWNGSPPVPPQTAGIGWVSFNCSNTDNDCSVSNYKVLADLNMPPSATYNHDIAVRELPCGTSDGYDGACSTDCESNPEIYWDYEDPEGYPQEQYEIVFDRDNVPGNSNEWDRKTESSATDHYIPTDEGVTVNYQTTYYVHLKVWDNYGLESDWESTSFTTNRHAHPQPYFEFFMPEGSASAEEEIKFWDTSLYYEDATDDSDISGNPGECVEPTCSYSWTSPHASIVDASTATSTATYPNENYNQDMDLEVTDGDGYSCSTSTSIYINKRLPGWEEVR